MTAMIVPTASDVVRCIGDTLDSVILPGLDTLERRSAATTMRHLLRYVALRIDLEGQVLFDELAQLHSVLDEASTYFGAAAGEPSKALAAAINGSLAQQRAPDVYPSVQVMAVEIAGLRQHVCDALTLLQSAGEGLNDAGRRLHEAFRNYVRWQIAQEAKIIEPAFRGFGPRR
jgi:hypothetical protein